MVAGYFSSLSDENQPRTSCNPIFKHSDHRMTALIREAIEFHLEGLREDGLAVPEPSTVAHYVDV